MLTEVAGTNIMAYNPTLGTCAVNFPDNYQEVRNAEKATSKGVEVDIQAVPTIG